MMTPPLIWVSQVSLSTTSPQSCTHRTLRTFTKPVSVSTSTSANCTPPAPLEESPSCHLPCDVRGLTPSFRQAATQFDPRASATPVFFSKSWSAFVQASKMAGQTDAALLLPPLPPDGGYCVSPILAVTCSGLSPKTSAATTATSVRVPVPRSWVPQRTCTLPSGLICTSASEPRPPPPQVAPAQPIPTLIGPGEEPGGLYFCFQPKRSMPTAYSRWRILFGSFFRRSSTGSIFNFAASASTIDSMPNEAMGWPGARKARAWPALIATEDCFTRMLGTT